MSLLGIWLGLSCANPEDSGASEEVVIPPGDELALPSNIDSIDFVSAFTQALRISVSTDIRSVWAGHVSTFDGIEAGCPDFYTGAPDLEQELNVEDDQWVWYDTCITSAGREYSGVIGWDNLLSVTGDAADSNGQTSDGSRQLVGDATVSSPNEVLFEFDGEASDSLTVTEAPGYTRWVYSSSVVGTVSGAEVEASIPGGWRTDLYQYRAGGDTQSVEIRGNLFYFDNKIDALFDSLALDIGMSLPATPDTCDLEPAGWIGVRDANAFWYDLVFGPRYPEESTEPAGVCDGCGTLYIRGIAQPQMTVCLDFSMLWADEAPESPEAYVFSVRDLILEEP